MNATMTQQAVFPNIKLRPNLASQAFLYFNTSIGTLTKVSIKTEGPCVGVIHYGGVNHKNFSPPVQEIVLTSPEDLATFNGFGRIPISIAGHVSDVASNVLPTLNLTITYYYNYNITEDKNA